MGTQRRARIVDKDGVLGRLRGIAVDDDNHPIAVVQLSGGIRVRVPFELLHHDDEDAYSLAGRWSDFALVSDEGATIPVIEQRVTVDVRPAPEKTLRARRKIVTESRVVEVPVWQERIEVERVPVDQVVTEAPSAHYEGDVLVIPCVEEIPVVEIRLRVREELRVRVVRERHVHRETVTLRRHDIEIETITSDPKHEGD